MASRFTRRGVLKTAGLLGAYGASPFAMNLLSMNAHAASTSGYRALVCVFLFGGMDCHDTVIPYDVTNYNAFAQSRQALMNQYAAAQGGSSRSRDRLLALTPSNDLGGRQFALPEALAPVRDLFSSGNAAIVANVGPLIEPLNRDQYRNDTRPRPSRLFSHNDQQSTWMASEPEGAQLGWGGRIGDIMLAARANTNASLTAVSASGSTVFLVGDAVAPFQIGSGGPIEINAVDRDSLYRSAIAPGLIADQLQDTANLRSNLFERDLASVHRQSITLNRDLGVALGSQSPLATVFPANGLGGQLSIVARLIAARATLGVSRQVFFVSTGGYDTHSNQGPSLAGLHGGLASALRAFYDATVELGVANEVTSFTASDFGRTLTVNGDGTDHGWGAHHFVIGGSVAGNRILGDMPPPVVNHSQDTGNGRLIPVVSVDQYAASFARWFGLTDSETRDAIPGVVNFPTPTLDLFNPGAIA